MGILDFIFIVLMSIMNLLGVFVGITIAQYLQKGEKVELPTINPIKLYEKHEEKRMIEQAEKEANIMLENINNYDGTTFGQKDIN